MKYERLQVDFSGRIVDWNGPFVDVDEACEEAADLADDYRQEFGFLAVASDYAPGQPLFTVFGPSPDNFRAIIVRPIA